MKRRADGDGNYNSPPESKAEQFAQRLLAKSGKILLILGIALAVIILVAFLVTKFRGGGS